MGHKPPSHSFVSLSQQAQEEWLAAMSDVEPYLQAHAALELAPSSYEKRNQLQERASFAATLPHGRKARAQALPALKQGAQDGIHAALRRSLKRGQLAIDAVLDLHGKSQRAAQEALHSQIARSLRAQHRLLLVITGKGTLENGGVLRKALPSWLNDEALRPFILAFDVARTEDGGSGAFYVLLRKGSAHP